MTYAGNYNITGRIYCPNADGDSFWKKVAKEPWTTHNTISPKKAWVWYSFGMWTLAAGSHIPYVSYREDDAPLDKISVSDYPIAPTGTRPASGNPLPVMCAYSGTKSLLRSRRKQRFHVNRSIGIVSFIGT